MYSEWVSLQTAIQTDNSHSSVLKRFPSSVGKDIVTPVVKNIAQGLSINSNDQPSRLHTGDEVSWTMEVICYGLSLPFSEHDIIKECVNIYCEWLSGCLMKKKLCVPKPVMESPSKYSEIMLSHLYNLFVPREKSTLDQVNRQAMLCHRTLRKLEDIAKESTNLSRQLWEAILKFLLAVTDTLLAPPKEKDSISDELAERVISVLFQIWLLSCSSCFPSPSLWRTFRDMCANWRHHEAVIVQWNRVNFALTAPLLVKLYGPDHPEFYIAAVDRSSVAALTKDCISKLTDDCLIQCWFRFLHILSNPVDLCRIEVISETPKFLHHALSSEKVIEPHQHECLQQLPQIFHKAMRGISHIMDSFLGARQPQREEDEAHIMIPVTSNTFNASTPPLSKHARSQSVVLSASHKAPSPSKQASTGHVNVLAAPSNTASPSLHNTSGILEYDSRPSLSVDRSSINSILNLVGAWLFEAALCYATTVRRPGSVSHHTGSMSSPSSLVTDAVNLSFDHGRAEACGAIARLLCSKRSGELIQPIYIARSYMSLYHALSLAHPIKGDVLTFTLFHMADILRLDLPGVNILMPKILPALESILATTQYNFVIHESLNEVELRKACIHLLLSITCLPLHYNKTEVKDLFTGELVYSYVSLKSRVAKLILNALNCEKDSSNCTMLLGALALLVQDYSLHEYREQEKLSSDTSSLSVDHYNLTSSTLISQSDSQSLISEGQISQLEGSMGTPEVVMRKSKHHEDYDSASGLLGIAAKQICKNLISSWCKDYNLALSALEVLSLLAKVKLQIVSTAMCKETVLQICRLIVTLCSRPPKNQTRDLHSMIVASFYCLSQWILEHSYLLQIQECLYTILEVVELGISGKKSSQTGSSKLILKHEKDPLAVSLRVRDAAESLLMCVTDQVDSFPCPCGSESLYSTLSERDINDDPRNFKYFSLSSSVLLAISNESGMPDDTSMLIKLVVRGPFGKQVWMIKPKSHAGEVVKQPKIDRPKPADQRREKPPIKQKWWPCSVDSIPLVKADKTLPSLDELDDLDGLLATIISNNIEKETKDPPRKPSQPQVAECQPPKPSQSFQASRVVLSQLGLLSTQSLQDPQNSGPPPYMSMLDSKADGFMESLANLDRIPNRTQDTVYIFYVKSGQSKVSDILDNTKGYKFLNLDYKDFLLSLGWPVNVQTHPGWTGLPRSHAPSRVIGHDLDQIPSSCGPSAFDGTKWLLYWADSRSEVAFIVPTEERIMMVSKLSQVSEHGRCTLIASRKKVSTSSLLSLRRGSLDISTENWLAESMNRKASLVSSLAMSRASCEFLGDNSITEDDATDCEEVFDDRQLTRSSPGLHQHVACSQVNKLPDDGGRSSWIQKTRGKEPDGDNTSIGHAPLHEADGVIKTRKLTYDIALGVISPDAWETMIRSHEMKQSKKWAQSINTIHSPPLRKKAYGVRKGIKKIINRVSDERPFRKRTQSLLETERTNVKEDSITIRDDQSVGRHVLKSTPSIESKEITFTAGPENSDNTSDSSSTLTTSSKDRSQRSSSDVRMLVIWCEKNEDRQNIPWEALLNTTNSLQDQDTPNEYMIVYITPLQSGLLRVHITCQTDRWFLPMPLVNGMVCSKRSIGLLIRQTAVNVAARRRLLNELSLIPQNKRVQKTQDIISRYRVDTSEAEFYEMLFVS